MHYGEMIIPDDLDKVLRQIAKEEIVRDRNERKARKTAKKLKEIIND